MTTTPLTSLEAEALAFAKARVAKLRDGLEPEAGSRLARFMLKRHAMQHPDNMAELKAAARAGWGEAEAALRELVREILGRGANLPPQLADFTIDALHPNLAAKPRGPKKSTKVLRDLLFVRIVAELAYHYKLSPTRSRQPAPTRETRRHSASSILAIALKEELPGGFGKAKSTERAIEQVWDRFGPTAFRWAEKSVVFPVVLKA